jgi:hypothetical protein
MNYLNDSNWTGRTPRSLSQSKWGTASHWEGYDNDARPGFWDYVAIVSVIAAGALVLFVGPMVFA